MSTKYTMKFVIKPGGRTDEELKSLLDGVYETASLQKAPSAFVGATIVQSPEGNEAGTVNAFFAILAISDDEAVTATERANDAIIALGIELAGPPELSSSKKIEPRKVRAPGITYDEPTGTLTIDTWAPDWEDVDLKVYPYNDAVMAHFAFHRSGRKIAEAVEVTKITIRRPAGNP
jgi:hypothetical protein